MRFLHPELLWLLFLLPLLAFYWGKKGRAPSMLYSTTALLGQLSTARKTSSGKIIMLLRLLSLALLIFALARPQLGSSKTEVEASGIDILLAVDVSGSMEAMDFTLNGKRTNRLEVVKNVVAKFVEERPNDRVGLIAFAGRPYMVCPLTLDHDWLKLRLESLFIGIVKEKNSTAIGSAIGSSVNRLRDQKSKSRIIILLTDGVNNAGKIPPLAAAEAARSFDIKVYTIGVGTRGLAPVPVSDAFGRKKLRKVRVDIDEKTLTEVADITGARYFRATDTASLEQVYDEINSMETTTRTIKKFENYRELFPYLIGLALLLLGIEVISTRKRLP